MLRLDFSTADLALPRQRDLTRRASISGVQDKVQLRRLGRRFEIVDRDGDYIDRTRFLRRRTFHRPL